MGKLYAQNKNIIDPVSNRYFFVHDPVIVHIRNAPHQVAHPMLHPGQNDKGTRALPFNESVLISSSEISGSGAMIRLKDLFNIVIESTGSEPQAVHAGDSLAEARAVKAQIIQWLPVENAIPCRLLTQKETWWELVNPVSCRKREMSSSLNVSVLPGSTRYPQKVLLPISVTDNLTEKIALSIRFFRE